MAGTLTTAAAAEGWTALPRRPLQRAHRLPPAAGFTQVVGRSDLLTTPEGGVSAPLSGVSGPAGSRDLDLTTEGYATASMLGGFAGGAIVGYLASGDPQGAVIGGGFTGGMAAVGDAFLFAREKKAGAATVVAVLGLTGIGLALYSSATRRRSIRRRA